VGAGARQLQAGTWCSGAPILVPFLAHSVATVTLLLRLAMTLACVAQMSDSHFRGGAAAGSSSVGI